MKKYNIKTEFKGNWMEYTNCYFIGSLEEYKEYLVLLNNKFLISETEIETLKTFIGHGHSLLTGISGMFCGMIDDKEKRGPMLDHLKYLQVITISNQLKSILEGEKLVINKNGGYFNIPVAQKYEAVEISGSTYTEKDIKTKKWWGGQHYYAKVGGIDVVDDDGNVKWNSEKDAYNAAIKYMAELNKEIKI